MVKKIAILGSTGSIGRQTLSVCRELGIAPVALAAGANVDRLFEQIEEWSPELAVLADKEAALRLQKQVQAAGLKTRIEAGEEALCEVSAYPTAEVSVLAMVGMAGLAPTMAALQSGKDIALANKEVLVAAGDLVMARAELAGPNRRPGRPSGSERRDKSNLAKSRGPAKPAVYPVDSEHSAIWQCLRGGNRDDLKKIWLTASGGPFRNYTKRDLLGVTPKRALAHPTWAMGSKISIDSATLMNKGLELIEACHLFQVSPAAVEILVHPQSVIHSMVEWADGTVLAQLGAADMQLPIRLALTWPDRPALAAANFNPLAAGRDKLEFFSPDRDVFSCLQLAEEAIAHGGLLPAVMNAANEVAVERFLHKEIDFLDIPALIKGVMDRMLPGLPSAYDLVDIFAVAAEATERSRGWHRI